MVGAQLLLYCHPKHEQIFPESLSSSCISSEGILGPLRTRIDKQRYNILVWVINDI